MAGPDTGAQPSEIKASWSANYILLTLTLSVLTGALGYGVKCLFETPPSRVLAIQQQISPNLLGLDQRARTGIVATYRLKNQDASLRLQSYFEFRFRVRNAGNVGVENVQVFVINQTSQLVLLTSPSISTTPPELQTALSVTQAKDSDSNHDHWTIPLLNPGEAVDFSYIAYSTDVVDRVNLAGIARSKDWQIIREGDQPRQVSRLSKPLSELRGTDLVTLLLYYFVFQWVGSIYLTLLFNLGITKRFLRRLSGRRYADDY